MARYFVQFKPNTTLADKLMVFTGLTEEEVRNEVNREYSEAVMRIFNEQQAAQIVPNVYACQNQWVAFGTECVYYKRNCKGETEANIKYPISKHTKPYKEHEVSLKTISDWFKTAKPLPVDKDTTTQIGAHIEEFIEMLEALGETVPPALIAIKQKYYEGFDLELTEESKVSLLDSLADQVVTATGVAYFCKFKWDDALTEVNQSNFSKFENGKPVFNENRKIMKGKDYFPPKLDKYA